MVDLPKDKLSNDMPSIKKVRNDIENMRVLSLLSSSSEHNSQISELAKQVEEMCLIIDSFNPLFAQRGWIIYDSMDLKVAKAAIDKAIKGDMAGAEAELISYYNPKTVKMLLRRMSAVQAFGPRMNLAEKALVDYEEERYHACIPVVLALMDGLVNELHEKRRGFFAEETDLTAWDSIAAHDSGLNALVKLFQKGRYNTTLETIEIPYRNGIMHGMDLGYDNKLVAAKTWAVLFAIREWALKVESGMHKPREEDDEIDMESTFKLMQSNKETAVLLKNWKPRCLTVGIDIPCSGLPEDYKIGTPERKLAEYLFYWGKKNYGHMKRCISILMLPAADKFIQSIRTEFDSKELISFKIKEVYDENAFITEVETEIILEENNERICKDKRFRLINEDANGNFSVRGKQNTEWKIMSYII